VRANKREIVGYEGEREGERQLEPLLEMTTLSGEVAGGRRKEE